MTVKERSEREEAFLGIEKPKVAKLGIYEGWSHSWAVLALFNPIIMGWGQVTLPFH